MKKMKKKLTQSSGFTLAETLITVAIISLVCAGLVNVSGVVRNIYIKITRQADAETLLATTVTAMKADLSETNNVELKDGKVEYIYSLSRGYRMKYSFDETHGIMVIPVDDETKAMPLVTGKTMTLDMHTELGEKGVRYDPATHVFTFTVNVVEKGKEELVASRTVNVRAVNKQD